MKTLTEVFGLPNINYLEIFAWLFFVDILNTFTIQILFMSIFRFLDYNCFLSLFKNKKQIISLTIISTFIMSIVLRLSLINKKEVSLAGTFLLLLYFLTALIYCKIKVGKLSKYSVLKLALSFILSVIINMGIEMFSVFVFGPIFNLTSSDILYNLKNTLLLSIPLRITQIFIILVFIKTNKKIIRRLVKSNTYDKKNIIVLSFILLLSILNSYIFFGNNELVDSLSVGWKSFYVILTFLNVFLMLCIFFWANINMKKTSLSENSKLIFLLEIMDNLTLVTGNITNIVLLQDNLLDLVYSFVSPNYMYFIDKDFNVTSLRSNRKDLQKKVNNNKELIRSLYEEKCIVNNKNSLSHCDSKSVLYVPLFVCKKNYGIIVLEHKKINYFEESIIVLIKEQLEKIIENSIYQNNIKKSANHDYLTGIYNREYFNNFFNDLCKHKKKMGIMMIDIDFFKKVNDKHGHYAGDEVLKTIAKTISCCIRNGDVLARYGGEEFIVAFNDIDSGYLLRVAERIRTEIEKSETVYEGKKIKVTASLGISYSSKGNKQQLLFDADKALYSSKKTGRNKCTLI